jgi:hypothetical protein
MNPIARLLHALAALLLGLATSSPLHANAMAEVMVPLQAYLDGHATGEERHFRRAFAADGLLVGIKDGRYTQRSAADYIAAS